MKKLELFAFAFIISVLNVFGQTDEEIHKPDKQIIVNKEYDENGNLIGYDSTYIHKWSSDSTFKFLLDENFAFENGFPEMNDFFAEFFNDTSHFNFKLPGYFQFPMFQHEDLLKQFRDNFQDSIFYRDFKFEMDSTFSGFNMDSLKSFEKDFVFPDIKILEEQLNEHFRKHDFNNFQNPEHKKEWDKLMEKHRKEMKELQKKWNKED